jgi:hypothetical protein
MPKYPYTCAACDCANNWLVYKPMASMDVSEKCPKCGRIGERTIGRTSFYGATVEDAEFNPALGCVTYGPKHREEVAKRKGLVEIGNESVDSIHADADNNRIHNERISERELDKVLEREVRFD